MKLPVPCYFKCRPTSDRERLRYDPTGNLTGGMNRYGTEIRHNPIPSYVKRPQEVWDRFRKVFTSNPSLMAGHAEYFAYAESMLAKCGPQGGSYPLDIMLDILNQSYQEASSQDTQVYDTFIIGRDILIQLLREKLDDGYLVQDAPRSVCKTNAAIPTGRKKGDFKAETTGFHLGGWNHVWPDYLGQRLQRNKLRLIHQDSVINVRNIECTLSKVRNYLKTYFPEFFGSWLNPKAYLRPTITTRMSKPFVCIEGDYETMDAHVSRRICVEIVLPIYEQLLDPGEYLHLAAYVEEAFEQEVFIGDFMISGLHNLFSGQGITNDFETILTVCLLLGTLTQVGIHYRRAALFANGDDSAVILNGNYRSLADTFAFQMAEAANRAGLLMHREKTGLSSTSLRYCRCVYYPHARRDAEGTIMGAYPSPLTVNSIVHPEKLPDSPGIAAIATLARLDNLIGSPDYTQIVQFTGRELRLEYSWTQDDLTKYQSQDWWLRVYGETYNPENSPSYQLLKKCKLI